MTGAQWYVKCFVHWMPEEASIRGPFRTTRVLRSRQDAQVDFCKTLFIVSENSFITELNVFALIV